LKTRNLEFETLGELKLGTTTVVEINSPKICGDCESKKLKYMTEDYNGTRDTYWMCGCGWEDFGATYSLNSKVKIVGLPDISFIDDLLDFEKVTKKVGERGKDKNPRSGRSDKGKTRGPNKRTLVAAMNSKRGKSKKGGK